MHKATVPAMTVLLLTGLLTAVLLALATPARPAAAADAVVGSGTPQSCTEAAFDAALATVQAANEGAITFNCGGEAAIVFFSQKTITSFVIINGGDQITLSGGDTSRLFHVVAPGTLQLERITLTNGKAADGFGGAILAESSTYLYVIKSTIQNSFAAGPQGGGGAILAYNAPVTIEDSVIQSNSSNYGAINTIGPLTISNSILRANGAVLGGGALSVGGKTVITESQLLDNQAQTGGALFIVKGADVTIEGGVAQANEASDKGGAITNYGDLTVKNMSFSNNRVPDFSHGQGGGIYNAKYVYLYGVTMNRNSAGSAGGGIYNVPGASLNLWNTTMSYNVSAAGGAVYNAGGFGLDSSTLVDNAFPSGGTIYHVDNMDSNASFLRISRSLVTSFGLGNCLGNPADISDRSLFDDSSCVKTPGPGDIIQPRFAIFDLADNGGPTQTHMIPAGSPALDVYDCGTINRDQRGVARPQGAFCDIGAVERRADEGLYGLYLPLLIR